MYLRLDLFALGCSTSETSAVCVTSGNVVTSEGLVEMNFDRATVSYNQDLYRYVEDPQIFTIEPEKSILRSVSGQ